MTPAFCTVLEAMQRGGIMGSPLGEDQMTESHPTAYREARLRRRALLLTDCPFDTVTIVPDKPSIGALAREHLLGELVLEYEPEDEIRRNRNRIEDAIRVSLAGPYAQRRHDPSSKWRRGKDLKEASDLIYCLHRHCRSARDRAISSRSPGPTPNAGTILPPNGGAARTSRKHLI